MPNPENPEEAECGTCHDSGTVPGTYRLCSCRGVPIGAPVADESAEWAASAAAAIRSLVDPMSGRIDNWSDGAA